MLFEIKRELRNGALHVQLHGEWDLGGDEMFEEAVANVDQDPGLSEVVLDLRGLTFLDSSALRQIVLLDARSRADGFSLSILRPPQPAYKVFQITGTDELLPFKDG